MRPVILILAIGGLLACFTDRGSNLPPNLLLVVIDTLRFDHLSLYGYERPTSPQLEQLAARGWVFDRHVSHGAQTVPSTLSILLSRLPTEHGFVHRYDGQFAKSRPVYPQEFVFLAEVLMEHGYRTAAFVGNPFLSSSNSFDQGFGHFQHAVNEDRFLVDGALSWLRENAARRDSPFMVYVHLMGVHWPYAPPRALAERYRKAGAGRLVYRNGPAPRVRPQDLHYTVASYDAGINVADAQVGELVSELQELGVAQNTIVVVTSDHGDEFLEHGGLGHGTTVYGELVRAPLVIVYPGKLEPGRRVSQLTQHLDLAPTLLSLAGIEKPESFRGGSLFEEPEIVFCEEGPWRAVYAEGHKLTWNVETGDSELFAAGDALDQAPLDDPAREAELRAHFETYRQLETSQGRAARAHDWSKTELESLRTLGYVK